MNKINDKKEFTDLLKKFNIPFNEYNYEKKSEKDFFRDEAVEDSAQYLICTLNSKKQGLGDFYFDSSYNLLGFSNDSIDGYSKRDK